MHLSLSVALALLFGNVLGALVFFRTWIDRQRVWRRSVGVLVLGDIGRSPRMLHHIASLAKNEYDVFVFGYLGTLPPNEIIKNERITIIYLSTPLAFVSRLPKPLFLLFTPIRIAVSSILLLSTLMLCPTAFWPLEYLIVQNPPAIPTLLMTYLLSITRGTKVIVDWHNTGYSVLGMRLGSTHIAVKLAKSFELYFGRKAYAHLCVSKAMKTQLEDVFKVGKLNVFYDRPSTLFKKLSASDRKAFLTAHFKLPILQKKEPKVIISSTSWTEDEDFNLLLKALDEYDTLLEAAPIFMVITGKGQLKEAFEKQLISRKWTHVTVVTAWLSYEDYAMLLGCADLGISLHTSTSGLDLPMKVVDMLGAKLGVCAYDFACLDELVYEDKNGKKFSSAHELCMVLHQLLSTGMYDSLRQGIIDENDCLTWDENWNKVVRPLLE